MKRIKENDEEKGLSDLEEVIEANLVIHDIGNEERKIDEEEGAEEENEEKGNCSSMVKRRRERVMEEARNSIPENGKVMHLVKVFERLLSIKREKEKNEDEEENEKKNKVMKWGLHGLQFQQPVEDEDEQSEVVSGCRDDDASLFTAWDCGSGRSVCSRNSSGGRRSRRNCLLKPPVKESTKPIDVKLHSDLRAIDRPEFDHQVAEKLSLIEQQKRELEIQQKLAEEEEIRRLRKELIPKAQPMPYFDRPFIPTRSMKNPTIPKEPKFHIPHHKKIKWLTFNEMRSYSSCFN